MSVGNYYIIGEIPENYKNSYGERKDCETSFEVYAHSHYSAPYIHYRSGNESGTPLCVDDYYKNNQAITTTTTYPRTTTTTRPATTTTNTYTGTRTTTTTRPVTTTTTTPYVYETTR